MLISWITKNLVGCTDPRAHSKPLKGNLKNQGRYRIGDYLIM